MADYNFRELLISDFQVLRKIRLDDGHGGFNVEYDIVDNVRGRLSQMGRRSPERVWLDKYEAYITHVLFTEIDNGIRRGDIIVGEGKKIRVVSVREPSYSDHHLEIDCEEIQLSLRVLVEGGLEEETEIKGMLTDFNRIIAELDDVSVMDARLMAGQIFSGVSSEMSSLGGKLATPIKYSGHISGSDNVIGELRVRLLLSSGVREESLIESILHVARGVEGDSGDESQVVGYIRVYRDIDVNVEAGGNLKGFVLLDHKVFGDSSGISMMVGSLAAGISLESDIFSESDAQVFLKVNRGLISSFVGNGNIGGLIIVNKVFGGISSEESSLVGYIRSDYLFSAVIEEHGSLVASLTLLAVEMEGNIQAETIINGNILSNLRLFGLSESGSVIDGNLSVYWVIESEFIGHSSIDSLVRVDRKFNGSLDGLSQVIGSLSAGKLLIVHIGGEANIDGTVEVLKTILGQMVGIGEIDGSVVLYRRLMSDISQGSQVSGGIIKESLIESSIGNDGEIVGFLRKRFNVSSEVAGSSEVEGFIAIRSKVMGSISGASDISAHLLVFVPVFGDFIEISGFDGQLMVDKNLFSNISNESSLSGIGIWIKRRLVSSVDTLSSLEANLTVIFDSRISGSILGLGNLDGSISYIVNIRNGIEETSDIAGFAKVKVGIIGQININGSLIGLVVRVRGVSSEILSDEDIEGTLSVNRLFSVSLDSISEFEGFMPVERVLGSSLESITNAVGFISAYKPVDSIIESLSELSGSVLVNRWIDSSVESFSNVMGSALVDRKLDSNISSSSGVNGVLNRIVYLSSSISDSSDIGGFIEGGMVFTDFSEYATGSVPFDWTIRWFGEVVYEVREEAGVIGGKFLRSDVNQIFHNKLASWDLFDNSQDVHVRAKVRNRQVNEYQSWIVFRGSGGADNNTAYILVLAPNQIEVISFLNGVYDWHAAHPFVWSGDSWNWLDFRVSGSSIQGKVWADGSSEPGSYQINIVNNRIASPGWVGFGGQAPGYHDCDVFMVEVL